MPTSVAIQHTISHGTFLLFILFICLILPLIIKRHNKKKAKKAENKNYVNHEVPQIPLTVKEDYSRRLTDINRDHSEGKISSKEGYMRLSAVLREFILEYLGVDVTKKTLAEIKRENIPTVANLIEEYYIVEFSPDKEGDFYSSYVKTIKAINDWEEIEKPNDISGNS